MALPNQTHLTEAEYLAMERDSDIKHEYVGGVVYAMSGAKKAHIRLTVNLISLLASALQDSGCMVYSSDLRVRVSEAGSYFYPDVTVVCGEEAFVEDEPAATLTNPTLIVEVLSDSTEQFDRTTKFDHYLRLPSLQDYVLVYQNAARVDRFSRGDGGTWVLHRTDGLDGTIALPSLDLTLTMSAVYANVTFPDTSKH